MKADVGTMHVTVALLALTAAPIARALDNGAARTPPMGFNSYMSGLSGAKGLSAVADFFVSSGLAAAGYQYVNTDAGWALPARDAATGELQWDPKLFPGGGPAFIDSIHAKGLRFGIYGAASGVTCDGVSGQLYHEDTDADTFYRWGVDYYKSDNCATYAMDSSVRFGAMRDALLRAAAAQRAPMVYSIEPFSINPDPSQSVEVANLWRVATDIQGDITQVLLRADISDKWSPLAGPGGWNDPDMINVQNYNATSGTGLTLGENRIYFGLWALMKAPLLLSADLPALAPAVVAIVNNSGAIAVNQDPLGVQARKLATGAGAAPLPWLVGLADCGAAPARFYSRGLDPAAQHADTRRWTVAPASLAGGAATPADGATDGEHNDRDGDRLFSIANEATNRCLAFVNGTAAAPGGGVALLPCRGGDAAQAWRFDKGLHTVTSITNAAAGRALAVANATLYARVHAETGYGSHGRNDSWPVSDAAYGAGGLTLARPYDQGACARRNCSNYDATQLWYYSAGDRKLRHALYASSINHKPRGGAGYTLSAQVPTWRHHCLAHVLSVGNWGTTNGTREVWGGPLDNGAFVVGLLNRRRGGGAAAIAANFSLFGVPGVGDGSSFEVQDLWKGASLGVHTGGFSAAVAPLDLGLYRLDPASVAPSNKRREEPAPPRREVAAWMSIDVCGGAPCANFTDSVKHIAAHSDVLDRVIPFSGARDAANAVGHNSCAPRDDGNRWVAFHFGWLNSFCEPSPPALVRAIVDPLRAAGVAVHPVLEGGPSPAVGGAWPANDSLFFRNATAAALKYGLGGYSIDFEPTGPRTADNATALHGFARFLARFTAELHAAGLELTVAVPNGNLVNGSDPAAFAAAYRAIADTGVDRLMTMDTYQAVPRVVPNALQTRVAAWQAAVPNARQLGVGFGALYPQWEPHGDLGNATLVEDALAVLGTMGVAEVDLFELCGIAKTCWPGVSWPPTIASPWPPDAWWPALKRWKDGS